jgi:predicted enzyme related to lactoylglutathione lyase
MKKVTSLGGVFVKCKDPKKVREWYQQHLGINTDEYGTSFEWRTSENPEKKGYTVWSTFKEDTDYFKPSEKDFMLNFRVENLEWLLGELKKEGVQILGEIQTYSYGKFAHILDLEGNKIELWEAIDEEYEKMVEKVTK